MVELRRTCTKTVLGHHRLPRNTICGILPQPECVQNYLQGFFGHYWNHKRKLTICKRIQKAFRRKPNTQTDIERGAVTSTALPDPVSVEGDAIVKGIPQRLREEIKLQSGPPWPYGCGFVVVEDIEWHVVRNGFWPLALFASIIATGIYFLTQKRYGFVVTGTAITAVLSLIYNLAKDRVSRKSRPIIKLHNE